MVNSVQKNSLNGDEFSLRKPPQKTYCESHYVPYWPIKKIKVSLRNCPLLDSVFYSHKKRKFEFPNRIVLFLTNFEIDIHIQSVPISLTHVTVILFRPRIGIGTESILAMDWMGFGQLGFCPQIENRRDYATFTFTFTFTSIHHVPVTGAHG